MENGDHTFLVIGRLSGSDPNDPKTWGEDAWICDSTKVYRAQDYQEGLKFFHAESTCSAASVKT